MEMKFKVEDVEECEKLYDLLSEEFETFYEPTASDTGSMGGVSDVIVIVFKSVEEIGKKIADILRIWLGANSIEFTWDGKNLMVHGCLSDKNTGNILKLLEFMRPGNGD